jgi:hypothetical protein
MSRDGDSLQHLFDAPTWFRAGLAAPTLAEHAPEHAGLDLVF